MTTGKAIQHRSAFCESSNPRESFIKLRCWRTDEKYTCFVCGSGHNARMRKRGNEGQARENKHVYGKGGGGLAKGEDALDSILASNPAPLIVVLDCVTDPHNLGAILRTADGAGVAAVVAPKDKSVGLTETVQRIAVGAASSIPFVRVTNLARTMKKLQKDHGVWLIGTSDKATQTLYDMDLKGPVGIVMGAEGDGMRRLTEENCDLLIQIPMAGKVDCLNVSVATGVCLYEAVRQRGL